MIKIIIKLFRFFITPKENHIIYHSFPDVSDNCFSFFCYIINNHLEYKNIWLINNGNKEHFSEIISNYTNSANYKIVKKNSIKGVYYYCLSKYVTHTHGIFNNINLSTKQININLWHGMPLKNIGHLDNNNIIPKSNFVIATSKLFQKIMSQAFLIDIEKVIVTGQPRNDLVFTKNYSLLDLISSNKEDFNKIVLWMPTYRKSDIGDVRIDSEIEKSEFFLEETYLKKLNQFFSSINSACFIKLHPMDFIKKTDFSDFSNLFFLNNNDFNSKGISLYSVLQNTDMLLTDFSSIYIDYLLVNKPIAFLVSDFNQYLNSRGLVFDKPINYMPGEIIKNKEDLILFLKEVFINKNDLFEQQRNKIKEIFHEPKLNFSKNVFNTIFKKDD